MTRQIRFILLALMLAVAALIVGHALHAQSGLGAGIRVDTTATSVPQDFVLSGALNSYDFVNVWGFPSSGAVYLGGAWATAPDRGLQLPSGGWDVLVMGAPVGTYPIVIYAHDPATNTFPVYWSATYTVRACTYMTTWTNWIRPSTGGGQHEGLQSTTRCD